MREPAGTATDASDFAPFTPRVLRSAAEAVRGSGDDATLTGTSHWEESMRASIVSARVTRVAALIFSATALACGGSGSSASTAPPSSPPPVANGSTTNLSVTNNRFSPATDSVAAGSTLTWTWDTCTGDGYGGSSCGSHSVQFDDDGPSSSIKSSGTFSRMFADAGTYTYHCAVHGIAMSGTITVH